MSPAARVGVMGGTFDPIHLGHLVAASEVAYRFALDRVLFVPTGQPWHKREVSAAEHRVAMTELAVRDDPRFDVSRADVDRDGPTYTVDTLRDLRAELGDEVELFFITGADALGAILTWRDPAEVLRLAHLVGVTRPGHELADPGLPEGSVSLVEVPAMAISSTDLRARAASGAPVRYLVPASVERYLVEHGLYRATS